MNCLNENDRISKNVVYVGMQNPCMRTFDIVMHTAYGTTYNSYLVMGEKNVLVDTVHNRYTNEYIQKIKEYVPIEKIDYIICNHTEPDHSGSLNELLNINPNIEVIGSSAAIKNLGNITNRTFKSRTVKTGDILDIGNDQIFKFIIAPNLHWPDSMFTYYEIEKVLFSCDVFGSHYCEQFLFDYQLKRPEKYESERKNYFDCIFAPFKKFVLDGIAKIEGLEIDFICCSHGPVIKERIQETIELYKNWADLGEKSQFVPIFYVSAYGFTKAIANTIKDTLVECNIDTQVYDLLKVYDEDMATLMNDSKAVIFGSPTINADALEPVWDLINKTIVTSARGKNVLVFGSYGWSGEGCGLLGDRLKGLKYNVYPEYLKVQFKPSQEDLQKVIEETKKFVELL